MISPDLFTASRRKVRSVCQALLGDRWIQDLRGRVTTDLLPSFVRLCVCVISWQPLTPGTMDSFRWRLTDNGIYTTTSAYKLFFIGSTTFPLRQEIWKAWAPPKCRTFAWLLAQRWILTADSLLARQWPNSNMYAQPRDIDASHERMPVDAAAMGNGGAPFRNPGAKPGYMPA